MKTAEIIWAGGKITTQRVIKETEKTFVTDDVNSCRWWKHNGMRVGAMNVPRNSTTPLAFAKLI